MEEIGAGKTSARPRNRVFEAVRSGLGVIVERVNSYAKKETTPAIEEFITKLNLIVKRYNTLINQRKGHHHGHGGAAEGSGGEEGAGTEGNEA